MLQGCMIPVNEQQTTVWDYPGIYLPGMTTTTILITIMMRVITMIILIMQRDMITTIPIIMKRAMIIIPIILRTMALCPFPMKAIALFP